nr:MAG TPA: hypothetical protein [Caudoviricetes sp.]
MTKSVIIKLYKRACNLISEYCHGNMDEDEFSKSWQRLTEKIKHERKLSKTK